MEPARLGLALHKAVPRRVVRTYGVGEFNARQRGVAGKRFFGHGAVGSGKRFVDSSFVVGPAPYNGPIPLRGSAVHKFKLQCIQGLTLACKQDNPACGLVQPMHRLQPCLLGTGFVDEVAQVERLVVVDVRSVHQKPVGLHRGTHAFIFVENPERGRQGRGRRKALVVVGERLAQNC